MSDNWVDEDYRTYCRWFEQERDNGNGDPCASPMSFDLWLCEQTPEYRSIHADVIDGSVHLVERPCRSGGCRGV